MMPKMIWKVSYGGYLVMESLIQVTNGVKRTIQRQELTD